MFDLSLRNHMRALMHSIVVGLLLVLRTCCGDVPRLLCQESFTSASFAEAVNHFVSLGEASAVKELNGLVLDDHKDFTNGFSANVRIGLMCRVLFEPRGSEPIRPPAYGWLDVLGSIGLPPVFVSWNNIQKNWPLYPVARSGSSYFILSQNYSFEGFGGPEDTRHYIEYCRTHGHFRKALVKVPTKKQALKDVTALRQSKEWKAIKWKDSGQGYNFDMSEDYAWMFIQKQAEVIASR